MKWICVTFLCCLSYTNGWRDSAQRKFKEGFLFGTSTAAYQVEGGWDTDGKGESIWDRFLHTNPDIIVDGKNGDVAADSYNNYKRDVEMLRELGVDFYRFSISWPRILPTGFPNNINEKGIQYYHNLIDELLKYNIEPMITLYHFDLPQKLQDLGGWVNPLSIQWFEDYAKVVFDQYASKSKYFVTINQPNTVCSEGYGNGQFAPAVESKEVGEYICIKNVLLAHAKVYRLYEAKYKNKYKGLVGISISVNWAEAIDDDVKNVKAAEEFREFNSGIYINPIFSKEGDFPTIVKDIVAKKSSEQGYFRSRLPKLTAAEIELLKGSADFLGLNHYTTLLISRGESNPSQDLEVIVTQSKEWKQARSAWLKSAPYGLYKACIHINQKYNYPQIIITENGWSTDVGLKDQSRVDYIKEYLKALLYALEDGTEVKGYTAWSLMDNVEWIAGTSERFGLYEVDYDSPDKKRKPRLSAHYYKHIIDSRVPDDWEPKSLVMTLTDRRLKRVTKAKDEL